MYRFFFRAFCDLQNCLLLPRTHKFITYTKVFTSIDIVYCVVAKMPKRTPAVAKAKKAAELENVAKKPKTGKTVQNKEIEEDTVENEEEPPKKTTKAKIVKPKKKSKTESSVDDDTKKEEPSKPLEQKTQQRKRGVAKENKNEDETPPKRSKRAIKEKEIEVVKPKEQKNKRGASNKKLDQPSDSKTPANITNTNYKSVSFECTKKNAKGETYNLRISSWNVDGLRSWLKKGGLEFLEKENPDILCLQETKCSDSKIPEEIKSIEGYYTYWCASKKDGYAGVAVLTKNKPLNVKNGIGEKEHDEEGRCITAEFDTFYLVNVYVPNAGRKLVTLPKRLEWNNAFKAYIKELDKKKPVILCGDMNVAHNEIDLTNPKTNTKNAGFTKEEREGMTEFLADGYVDTFRNLYPDQKGAYTFWSYMNQARTKNIGWRLDYFIVSERLMDRVCDNQIRDQVYGSDHCPLTLFLNV